MSVLPPIEMTVTVRCGMEEAFRVFTEEIGTWWPMERYSIGQAETESVHFEARRGGEIFELTSDGTKHVWGTVLVFEPSHRVVFTWHPGKSAQSEQEVELSFRAIEGGTEVTLQHRRWETLGDEASAVRDAYVHGWPLVFGELYRQAADAAALWRKE